MRQVSCWRAIVEAQREEMTRDKDVFIMGEDVGFGDGAFGCTKGLYNEFGAERVIDTPISESGIVGLALGAALVGLRPIAEIMFMDFLAQSADQIISQVAKARYMCGGQLKVPLTIRTAAGPGGYAGPQHAAFLENWFVNIPGLRVVLPSTPMDVKGLLKSAIRDDNPVIFVETRSLYTVKDEIPDEEYVIPLGKADIKKEGTDVTVVALGRMVYEAKKAAQTLETQGVSIEIVDPRTVSPLDKETIINSVKKTSRLVIAHEAVKIGGIGGEIAGILAEEAIEYLDAPIQRVGAPFTPNPYSKPLEDNYRPSSEHIIAAVMKVIQK